MQIHGSCVSRESFGVLLLGPPGCGKSDLVLRLLECGFVLVADDRVNIANGVASAPPPLVGLLEVRGLGILRLPFVPSTKIALVADLTARAERLPIPQIHTDLNLPLICIDPSTASAPIRIARALDCALGRTEQIAGSFRV